MENTNYHNSSAERKLVAILFADIQGYTSLMQKNEAQASMLLKRFQDVLSAEVKSHKGEIVNFYGDGALCMFHNPLEALHCAMKIQTIFQVEPIIPVRLGIHMGSVVIEGAKAYGDSINIASRIESLSLPGSILLSKRVRDELKNQPDIQMKSLGKFDLKNVDEPLEIFAIANEGYVIPKSEDLLSKAVSKKSRKWKPLSIVMGIIIIAAMTIWTFKDRISSNNNPDSHSAHEVQRLAVLPFSNLRGDPDTDFLGLALADEIIGDLGYISELLVRPSSSVRKYSGATIDAPSAGKELQVDYILIGTYLKEGNLIRMDIELVGTGSNERIWWDEIEEEYQNAFHLQDIVAEKVLEGLKVQFSEEEDQRRTADISHDPLAYEYYLRSVAQPSTVNGNILAIELLKQSIGLDSLFAPAWGELGFRMKQRAAYTLQAGQEINEAERTLRHALSLNPELLIALSNLVAIYVETGRTDQAVETARQAIDLDPNSAENHLALGYVYRYAGYLEHTEEQEETALSLDPENPRIRAKMGTTQIYLGQLDEALRLFQLDNDSPFSLAWQGQIYLRLGKEDRALEKFNRVVEMDQEGVGHWCLSHVHYLKGNPEKALEVLLRLEENLVDAEQYYNMANLYSLFGYKEHCIRILRKTVDGGFFSYPVFMNDQFLDPVRDEPEFQSILEEVKIKHEAFGKKYF